MERESRPSIAAEEARRFAPAKLAHVAIRTASVKRAAAWYKAVLNAAVAFENEQLCFLAYDEEHHRLAIVEMPGLAAPAADAWGLEHFSFCYRTIGELLATYRRLARIGIVPFWTIIHGPTTSMYYRDPDGNKVELQIDNFETREELDRFFAQGNYLENPMGVIFDPEEMIRRYEAGVPLRELVRRPKLPPGMSPWDMLRT
jgi:catechol 2,3-dioxygenase-like lactoylglutathione lyase family enzyme